MSARWWSRAVVLVAATATAWWVGEQVGLDPDPVRVLLVTSVVVAGVGLLLDTAPDPAPGWRLEAPLTMAAHHRDPRTATNLRILEHHLAVAHPDAALRDRLRELSEQVLWVRHAERPETARAYELMGTDLVRVLNGPARRLRLPEVEACVRRIEEL